MNRGENVNDVLELNETLLFQELSYPQQTQQKLPVAVSTKSTWLV